jgi:hypothetical protein
MYVEYGGVAISELYQDGVVPSGPWARLEIHADRSIQRALNGDRRVMITVKTACLPISQAGTKLLPNRDEGELYLSRGPKPGLSVSCLRVFGLKS